MISAQPARDHAPAAPAQDRVQNAQVVQPAGQAIRQDQRNDNGSRGGNDGGNVNDHDSRARMQSTRDLIRKAFRNS